MWATAFLVDLGLVSRNHTQGRPPPVGGDVAAAAPGSFKKKEQVVVTSLNIEKYSVSRALLHPLDPILAAAPHPSRGFAERRFRRTIANSKHHVDFYGRF